MSVNVKENVATPEPAPEEKVASAPAEAAVAAPAEEKDPIAEQVKAAVAQRIEQESKKSTAKKPPEKDVEPPEEPEAPEVEKASPPPDEKEKTPEEDADDLPPELLTRAEAAGLAADDLRKVSPGIRRFFVSQFEKVIAKETAETERRSEAAPPESKKPAEASEFKPVEINMDGYEEDTKTLVTPLLQALNETRKELHDLKTEHKQDVDQRAEQGQRAYEEQVLGFFNHSVLALPSEELAFFGEKPQKGSPEYTAREEMWDVFADLLDLNEKAAKPKTFKQVFDDARAQYMYPKAREVALKQIQNKVKSRSRSIADPPSTRKAVPSEKPQSYAEVRAQEAKKIDAILAGEKT